MSSRARFSLASAALILLALLGWAWLKSPGRGLPGFVEAGADQLSKANALQARDAASLTGPTEVMPSASTAADGREEALSGAPAGFIPAKVCRLDVSVTYATGEPAENVEIALRAQSAGPRDASAGADPTPFNQPASVAPRCSDAMGQVRFEGLASGVWQVSTDRGQSQKVELVPGESGHIEFRLPAGFLVSGRVVDPSGRPVAGAQLWLTTNRGDALSGRQVGQSDAQGGFRILAVPPQQSVGAFASGYGPSDLVDLEQCQAVDGQVDVLLQLATGGAQLFGRVLARDGSPIAGAELAWGHPSRHAYMRQDGSQIEAWGPRLTRSNPDGCYALNGLPAETNQLNLRAAGFGLQRIELRLEPGQSVSHDFVLDAGILLQGRVRDETGAPVTGALVCALEEAAMTQFLGAGQIEYARVFGYAQTRSAADGSYRLGPLDASQRYLYAFAAGPAGQQRAVCRAEGLLGVNPEGEQEWNPVLERGASMVGRVEFADGEAAPDQFVELSDETNGQEYLFQTDDQGRFEFLNLSAGPFTLVCKPFGGPEGSQPARLKGLAPSDEPRVLRLDFDAAGELETGRVSGRVDDRGQRLGIAAGSASGIQGVPENAREPGNPPKEAGPALAATLDSGRWQSQAVEWSGLNFVFPRVSAGRWRVLLWLRGSPIGASEWFELAPGQELDLGPIVTEPAAQLTLLLDRPGVTAEQPLQLVLTHDQGYRHDPIRVAPGQTQVSATNLSPGRWRGLLRGEQVVPSSFEFELLPAGQSQVELSLASGANCTFSLAGELKAKHSGWRLEILSATGTVLFSELLEPPGILSRSSLSTCLAPGRYTARWTSETGGSSQQEIQINSLEPQRWSASPP